MKTIWKVVVLMIVAGLALSFIGISLGASRWVYWNKSGPHIVDNSDEKRITELDLVQIENIDIDANFSDVEFIKSDKYGIDICYRDANASWSLDSGCLRISLNVHKRIRGEDRRFFDINLSFHYPNNYIKVFLPADVELGTVSVVTDSSDMKIGDFQANDVQITNSFGNLDTYSITCKKLQITCSSGDFTGKNLSVSGDVIYKNRFGSSKFETVTAKNFAIESDSGDVTVKGCSVQELDIKNGFGKLDAYWITCNRLRIEMDSCDFTGKDLSVLGGITYKNRFGLSYYETVTAKNFVIDSDSGDITVKGCSVESIDIKNKFGEITASNLVSLKTDIDANSTEINVSGEFSGQTVINNCFGDIRFATSKTKEDYTYDVSADCGDVTIDNNKGRSGTRGGNSSENSLHITNSSGNIQVYFAK